MQQPDYESPSNCIETNSKTIYLYIIFTYIGHVEFRYLALTKPYSSLILLRLLRKLFRFAFVEDVS